MVVEVGDVILTDMAKSDGVGVVPVCVRCHRPVRLSADQFEVFEKMHYVCFHYEFEHDPADPDEECQAGGCPSFRLDAPPRVIRGL